MFALGSFYISKYIFILLSCFHHLQGYASISRDGAMRSDAWKADTKLLLSWAHAHAHGLRPGIGGEGPAGVLLSLQRQQTQMAVARAGGIKSVGQHPMGEPWAFPWSQTTVIGRKEAWEKQGVHIQRPATKRWKKYVRIIFDLYGERSNRLRFKCHLESGARSGFHLVLMGTFIHINLVSHFK